MDTGEPLGIYSSGPTESEVSVIKSGTRGGVKTDAITGVIHLSTYMKVYKVGDIVDVKVGLVLMLRLRLHHGRIGQWCCSKGNALQILSWQNWPRI